MSIDLMDYANERLDDPQFIFSNPGESLLLSKGVVLPRDVLGLNEIVFLASGYVMNEEYVPKPRIAEKIKLEFKFVEVSNRRFNKKTKKRGLPLNSFHLSKTMSQMMPKNEHLWNKVSRGVCKCNAFGLRRRLLTVRSRRQVQ